MRHGVLRPSGIIWQKLARRGDRVGLRLVELAPTWTGVPPQRGTTLKKRVRLGFKVP
jgi:hypothetical protein